MLTFQSLWQWVVCALRGRYSAVGVDQTRRSHAIRCVLQQRIQQPETIWNGRTRGTLEKVLRGVGEAPACNGYQPVIPGDYLNKQQL